MTARALTIKLFIFANLVCMIGSAQSASQQQTMHVLRLKPHADLKQSVFEFAKAKMGKKEAAK